MSFLRCCCGSNPDYPSCLPLPADWASREYAIDLPMLGPLSLGRIEVPAAGMPGDDGKCDPQHPGWAVPLCAYHEHLFVYAQHKAHPCTPDTHYCWRAYGPLDGAFPGATWNTIRADMSAYPYGSADKTWMGSTATGTYVVQAGIIRCCRFDDHFTERNRSLLGVSVLLDSAVSHLDCADGPPRQLHAQSEYYFTYYGDPYTPDQGISPRVYLKDFRHVSSRYCVDSAEDGSGGFWTVADPNALGGVLVGHPLAVPSAIDIRRIA